MSQLPEPPVQLSEKALSELKSILEQDIGVEALNKLSEAEINHIGCYLLTLADIQLKIRLKALEKR
jgi:hypothetical protein